jgi:hypothetical protein
MSAMVGMYRSGAFSSCTGAANRGPAPSLGPEWRALLLPSAATLRSQLRDIQGKSTFCEEPSGEGRAGVAARRCWRSRARGRAAEPLTLSLFLT